MRVAITGGSGFIGSHVVDYMVKAGHEVVVIDYNASPHREDVAFINADITDQAAMLKATKGCEAIFHLAAISNVNHAFAKPVYCVELNAIGTANMLEAARQNRAKRFVFASTVWIYSGARASHVHEDSPLYMPGAGHIYTSTKIAGELFCYDYWKLYEQPFTILRYGIPYGPRMREELVIPIFLRKAFAGEPITIAGDGSQHRNYLYVEEIARAHVLALSEKAQNGTFNLEGRRRVSVREIAETINKLLGGVVKIEYVPARPGDYGGKEVSRAKTKRILEWEAKIDFEEGMLRTIAWYCRKHEIPLPDPIRKRLQARRKPQPKRVHAIA